MAQNMQVGVTLRLSDQFSGPLRQLLQNIQGLTRRAQEFNRALGGTGSQNVFGRLQTQVKSINNDVRQLTNSFQQLGRAVGAPSGGAFGQGQISGMRQMIQLQQQIVANNNRIASTNRMASVPGPPGTPTGPRGSGVFGRAGFNPNASIADRMQYRAVNFGEQSLVAGALGLDRARTQLGMLGLSEADQAEAERFARESSQVFRALNRAHVLDFLREIIPQFRTTAEAFQFTPELLRIQDWLVLNGSNVEQARSGMLKLTRAVALSSRLTGPEGNLTLEESRKFMEAYLRGAIIGGADVTPDQAFQLVKYMKSIGQTIDVDEMLRMFISMPDVGASTMGNQTQMFIRQLTGRATKEAMAAQQRAGLITGGMQENTAGGPRKFVHQGTVDEELLTRSPMEWVGKHIIGPGGFLSRSGIDPMSTDPGNPARIRAALRPLFSNASADDWINRIVNQIQEIRNQYETAVRLDTSEEQRQRLGRGSLWYQLQAAQSGLQDVMGSITENFKGLLPILETVREKLGAIAGFLDPKIGNPLTGMGLLGAGAIAGFLTFRRAIAAMGTWSRTLLGGGLGFMVGGPAGAITGGMLLRSMGGGVAAGLAAGAAGAAAGASFARRFVSAAGTFLRSIPKLLLWGAVIEGVLSIIDHWESVKTRLLGIWEELKQAAPTWLGGQGKGWGAIGMTDQGVAALGGDMRAYARSWERSIYDPIRSGLFSSSSLENFFKDYITKPWPDDLAPTAAQPGANVMIGAVTNNITVNVGGSNADPNTIGEAAGNAVGSQLRGLMTDLPPMP